MKEIKPIAFFHSPFTSKFGIPRQSGLVDGLRGRIVFEPEYNNVEALRGLEDFDYVWLIWGFSANEGKKVSSTVRPPRLGGNERVGVFASRSPFRPNGLGLSSVKIAAVGNGWVDVMGADLMDGTPIYDVKPYVVYADSHPDARSGFTDNRAWQRLEVSVPAEFEHLSPPTSWNRFAEHYLSIPVRIIMTTPSVSMECLSQAAMCVSGCPTAQLLSLE